MGALDRALSAYENALRHNTNSVHGLTACANILRIKEKYAQAVEYYQRALQLQPENGEIWSSLGRCYLMQDQLQKAYSAYQQALYFLPAPKEDPKLWYGIGILYDRYGSLEHAEEAFCAVLQMDKNFEKTNEILFRLGIIYKQQGKYRESLECFEVILRSPPSPLAHIDIWFQIGHVYEQLKDYDRAKDAYERVVIDAPNHAKVLQQLGWLYHLPQASFQNQDLAVQYLTKSLEADASDAQSWYLLGRAYMAGQKYSKAYEAYQQAVYRDGRNPTFWCSIGVLYFQINQFRDALDAYSRAIRINPYISEVWFDLGSLYESCNNQIADAIDAYERAAELDPKNTHIVQRLALLKNAQQTGSALPAAPVPKDVHPMAYASGPPVHTPHPTEATSNPPLLNMPQNGASHRGSTSLFNRSNSRGPGDMLPQPNGNSSTSNVRAGSPYDERDRRREDTFPPARGLLREQSPRGMHAPGRYNERPASRSGGGADRVSPRSISPPPPQRARSPSYASYSHARGAPPTQSPRYNNNNYDAPPPQGWEREQRRRENGRPDMPSRSSTLMSANGAGAYSRHGSPPPPGSQGYDRSPALPAMRDTPHGASRSPDMPRRRTSDESPRNGNGSQGGGWDRRESGPIPSMRDREPVYSSPRQVYMGEREPRRRYDPLMDDAPPRRMYDPPPPPMPPIQTQQMEYTYERGPPSPRAGDKRRRQEESVERTVRDSGSVASTGSSSGSRRQRRSADPSSAGTNGNGVSVPAKKEPLEISPRSSLRGESERQTPTGKRRSPPGPAPAAAPRTLDEDYDEGVADALIGLASFRPRAQAAPAPPPPPPPIQETNGNGMSLKRPPSPSSQSEAVSKRPRTDSMTLPPIATLSPTSPTSTTSGREEGEEREREPQQVRTSKPPSQGSISAVRPRTHSNSPRDREPQHTSPPRVEPV
ncbi:TPR-like protein [Exidia glandulosa HHB12029]|uniref:TPR-like protein n=1 Tax=Exidia glandulosa HHB12029 TaxID=1314781 RepID=A0A166A2T8_EXIGL|nr:TPR-like protein [Exidia glandulosa HHB12029]